MDRREPALTANPYAAPVEEVAAPQIERFARPKTGPGVFFLASVALAGSTFVAILALGEPLPVGLLGFGASALVAAWGLFCGIRVHTTTGGELALRVLASLANAAMMLLGALMAWMSTLSFTRGRQLRSLGRVLLPPIDVGPSWAAGSEPIAVAPELGRALAAQWRENGRTEHASVAAFARLSLDLMALGAPPALIEAANRDALDEIRHAQLCFSLARSLDGVAASPGAFPAAARVRTLSRRRRLALAELAVDSLIDGALHEGVSARIIAKLARRAEVPAIQAVLTEIAADEGRHAAHGWDVVRWCLDEGGRPVAQALLGALATLPEGMRSPLPEAAREGGWQRWGIHGHALEAEEYARTRDKLVRRVTALTRPTRAAA